MKRLMLDTCVVVDMLLDFDGMDRGVKALLSDSDSLLYASFETMRELVVLFNNKKVFAKQWKCAEDVINTVVNDLDIEFVPLRQQVGYTYSRLRLNTGQDHRDPSDHIIIAHAITEQYTLLSSDTRFWFYRTQGLDLVTY